MSEKITMSFEDFQSLKDSMEEASRIIEKYNTKNTQVTKLSRAERRIRKYSELLSKAKKK